MGCLPDFDMDVYLRNNEFFYEFTTTTTPPMLGHHQMQGSAEMLPAGMLVSGFNTPLVPSYNGITDGYYFDDVCDHMVKLVEYPYRGFEPVFETDNAVYPQLCNSSNHDSYYKVHDQAVPLMEEPIKVGKYSAEEKKDRILRYLKKRTQRNFNKTIKYACRKTLADKRVRVRGRFARNNDREVTTMNNHSDNSHGERELYDDIIKMKHDEDEWLREAMASLMYFPYLSG